MSKLSNKIKTKQQAINLINELTEKFKPEPKYQLFKFISLQDMVTFCNNNKLQIIVVEKRDYMKNWHVVTFGYQVPTGEEIDQKETDK